MFSVFVFYVAFRSQLSAIAEALERLLSNFFLRKKECNLLYKQLKFYSHMLMDESIHLFHMSSK